MKYLVKYWNSHKVMLQASDKVLISSTKFGFDTTFWKKGPSLNTSCGAWSVLRVRKISPYNFLCTVRLSTYFFKGTVERQNLSSKIRFSLVIHTPFHQLGNLNHGSSGSLVLIRWSWVRNSTYAPRIPLAFL